MKSVKDDILAYAAEEYGTGAEHLWEKTPENAVLRRSDNKKWYAVLMSVSGERLGLDTSAVVDIIDVKTDPLMSGSLRNESGILPAYHMNKEKWITIVLDGTVDPKLVCMLLDLSYTLAAGKPKKPRKAQPAAEAADRTSSERQDPQQTKKTKRGRA